MYTTISKNNFRRQVFFDIEKKDFSGCFIAGGEIRDALLGVESSDVDMFGANTNLDIFRNNVLSGCKQVFDSVQLKTFIKEDKKIQLIYRDLKTPEEAMDGFDFTICKFSYNGDIVCDPDALVHLFTKRLVINRLNPDFVVDSMRRMQKYIQKGYNICDGGIADMVKVIRQAEQEKIDKSLTFYPDGTRRIGRWD
ncbi:MAG: hypothetical protein AABY22_20445 [Nanoarchaeota archaeon]